MHVLSLPLGGKESTKENALLQRYATFWVARRAAWACARFPTRLGGAPYRPKPLRYLLLVLCVALRALLGGALVWRAMCCLARHESRRVGWHSWNAQSIGVYTTYWLLRSCCRPPAGRDGAYRRAAPSRAAWRIFCLVFIAITDTNGRNTRKLLW